MGVVCPDCNDHILETENRLPAWCASCGASLKYARPIGGATPPRSAPLPLALKALPASDLASRGEQISQSAGDLSALGEAEQVYRGSPWVRLFCWLACLVGFAFLALVVYVTVHPPKKPASPAAMLMLAGLGMTGAIGGLYFALKFRRLVYMVFRDALVECDGRDCTVIPWEQIRQIFEKVHPGYVNYRVVIPKGEIQITGDVQNHRALGSTIEEKVIERLLPVALKELEHGRAVSFGPLGVSRGALSCQGEQMPWHGVRLRVGLKPDLGSPSAMQSAMIHLHVYHANGPTAYLEIEQIPNYRLFLAVVREIWPQCVAEGI
jgi:uncharacterized protein DUF6585